MKLWQQMMEQKADLALYFNQDVSSSGQLTQSEVQALFESKSFDNWKKSRENEGKSMGALIKGINNVIKGLGVLAKILGNFGRGVR